MGIYAGCAAGDAVETAKVCADELVKLADRIEDAELARAKAQLKAHMFMAREQPLSRAEQGAGQVLLFGRLYPPAELAREVDAVTSADVARLGRRLLSAGRSATAVLGAKSALKAGEVVQQGVVLAAWPERSEVAGVRDVRLLLPFLSPRPRLRLQGRGVYLRPPTPQDYIAPGPTLRAQSRAFLEPWEPTWPEHDLSRAAFPRALGRLCPRDWSWARPMRSSSSAVKTTP